MLLLVGRVGRPHGVRGLVTATSSTDEPESRFRVGATLTTEPVTSGPLTVTHSQLHGEGLLLGFEGIEDRGAAEGLRGTRMFVESADVYGPQTPVHPDWFPDHQLLGLSVELIDGKHIGEITAVEHRPGNDNLVITHDGREVLVPFVRAIVPTVDLDSGRVTIDPPEGLLEL